VLRAAPAAEGLATLRPGAQTWPPAAARSAALATPWG
jgi:hypothetical protein